MNLSKILFALVIIAGIALVAYFLLGQFDQTKPIQDSINNVGAEAQNYVSSNLPTVLAAGGTVTTIGGVAASKLQDAKKKLNDTQVAASTQINSVLKQKEQVEAQAASVKGELEAAKVGLADTQKQLVDYKAQVEPQLTQVKNLENQVQTLKDENGQFVMSLMSSANGALVTNPVDGKVYSVLKVPPEIQVK